MAKTNSIKVPVNFGNVPDLPNNTISLLGTVDIFIPENDPSAPVTFLSAVLYIAWQDATTATGPTLATLTTRCSLASSPSDTQTTSSSYATTGENFSSVFGPFDHTRYFITDFGTSPSNNCRVEALINITAGTPNTARGVYAWFEICYEFDESAGRTRIHTICIPQESRNVAMGTALTLTASLPQLNGAGGLIEDFYGLNIIRHRWLEIKGNSGNTGTADTTISYRFDTGATQTLPIRENALTSSTYETYLIDLMSLDETTAHDFFAACSTTLKYHNLVVSEWVSFEYDPRVARRALNYIEIPVEFESPIAGTTSTVNHLFSREVNIPEPDPLITYSAIELNYNTNTTTGVSIAAGDGGTLQPYRNYAMATNVVCGMFSFQHRIDNGSASGGAIALSQGNNTFTVSIYRTGGGQVTNVSGIIKLLYSSKIAAQGIENHSHVCWQVASPYSLIGIQDATYTFEYILNDKFYWIQAAGIHANIDAATGGTSSLMMQARVLPGESPGDGWRELYGDNYINDSENTYGVWYVRARDEFRRYPKDVDDWRLTLQTSRDYRLTSNVILRDGLKWNVSYHTLIWDLGGTVSNSGGGTIRLDLYVMDSSGQPVFFDTTTIVGDGPYSFVVYDEVANYYVAAYEDNVFKGLSKMDVPALDFDISLSCVGGGGTYAHAYIG